MRSNRRWGSSKWASAAACRSSRRSSPTPVAINRLIALLEDRLAPRELIHGVLLDILGLGVLITGESGIGKSECALDLVVRGHRLVADDAVEVRRRGDDVVIGTAPELTRHHMELRGIGLINLRDMFGVSSTRGAKRVELVVHLERWDPACNYERLGLDDPRQDVLGVPIPVVRMPVAPGRNLAILVEVAARNQLLRARGQHAARDARGPCRPPTRRAARGTGGGRLGEFGGRTVTARRSESETTARRMRSARLVIVTGLSGSGKSQAIRALEDLGYFCVDNLPIKLLPTLAELTLRPGSGMSRAAVVIDVREGPQLAHFPRVYAGTARHGRHSPTPDLPRRE